MRTVIFGAGPAGLVAAYAMQKRGDAPVVLEKTEMVGGISRTIQYKGYYFDLGGHRFFTRFDEVQALWEEVLGADFIVRNRLSRIYYNGRFFDYPLKATNALLNLGLVESTRCMASYARARLHPMGDETTFEGWVSNRFGPRLFDIFFRSYTEKVWGIPSSQIGAEWASQRIKNLALGTAVKEAVLGPIRKRLGRKGAGAVMSLIEQFHYPKTGPGMLYDALRQRVEAAAGQVLLEQEVVRVEHDGHSVLRAFSRDPSGREEVWDGDWFLSSMPLPTLVLAMTPAAPADVLASAQALTFRHLLTIDLIIDHPDLFPDNWIYVHDPRIALGRIQNFKNWSPHMVPDPTRTSLGLEYFCSDDDRLWKMGTDELVALGKRELEVAGLLKGRVSDGTVERAPGAYPVYKRGYQEHLDRVTAWIRGFPNIQPIGRYGMFKYNNADHSALTALLAVENMHGASHDIWEVNTDSEYHEIRKPPPTGSV